MPRPFLTARWTDLFLATYSVPPALLEPRLPPGLTLDRRDGQAFVSLVAFRFLDTRVLGLHWAGCTNFAELNLRFYVRAGVDRGVVFVREFVPNRLVAWLARSLYNEPYRAAPLTGTIREDEHSHTADYRLTFASRVHTLRAAGSKPAHRPPDTSTEAFFKEHRWGYGVSRSGRPLRYEVMHPAWDIYPVEQYEIDLDWETVYGPEWAFLRSSAPYSTILAAGSEIAVYPKGLLPDSAGAAGAGF